MFMKDEVIVVLKVLAEGESYLVSCAEEFTIRTLVNIKVLVLIAIPPYPTDNLGIVRRRDRPFPARRC